MKIAYSTSGMTIEFLTTNGELHSLLSPLPSEHWLRGQVQGILSRSAKEIDRAISGLKEELRLCMECQSGVCKRHAELANWMATKG